MSDTFGERIGAAMLAAGFTEAEVASRLDVNRRTVERWLLARNPRISVSNLLKLSALLGVRPEWMMTGEGER